MSQHFVKLIQTGATAEIASAVEADPALVEVRDPQGVSALLWSVYAGQPGGARLPAGAAGRTRNPSRSIRGRGRRGCSPHRGHSDCRSGRQPCLHRRRLDCSPSWRCVSALPRPLICFSSMARRSTRSPATRSATSPCTRPSRSRGMRKRFRLLLAHGADPNATQVGGFTPLFSAATANRRDLAAMLIESGARAHHRSDLEKTAADFARERGHAELADWLDAQPA